METIVDVYPLPSILYHVGERIFGDWNKLGCVVVSGIRPYEEIHKTIDIIANKVGKSVGGETWYLIEIQAARHKIKYKHTSVTLLKHWKYGCVK